MESSERINSTHELSVLVVEDDPTLQRLLQRSLTPLASSVTVVGTAAGALDHLSEGSFSALACDVGLPDLSGLEVIEAARRDHRSMGIVAITGLADVDTAVATMKAGGDDFLAKPFNPELLWHVICKAVKGRRSRLAADQSEIYRKLAYTDALTNCPNRRFVEEQLAQDIEASTATGEPLTIGFLDIDNFKLFNDFLGHAQGDRVLREVSEKLQQCIHAPASFGRFGGDEFVLILPGLGPVEVSQTMARIRSEVARIEVNSESNSALVTEVSIGLSTHWPGCSPRELVAKAEDSMHLDKSGTAFRGALSHIGSGVEDASNLRSLRNLVKAIDRRDAYTRFHSDHATSLALLTANSINLEESALMAITVGGPVHDLGKIIVPDEILRKPGPLTSQERAHMEEHPVIGAAIMAAVCDVDIVVDLVRHHHERFDGNGYPGGLKGEEISFPTRLFSLSDAYSAMTTDRPYRRGLSTYDALEQIRVNKGTQFDPDLAEIFMKVIAAEEKSSQAA